MRQVIIRLVLILGLVLALILPPATLAASGIQTRAVLWSMTITVTKGAGAEQQQDTAEAAVANDATAGYDAQAGYEVPDPGLTPADESVVAYFPHPDWGINAGNYTVDTRPPAPIITWDMQVQAKTTGDVTVTWDISQVPGGQVQLVDTMNTADTADDVTINLSADPSGSYVFTALAYVPRDFQLIYVADADAPPVPGLVSPADETTGVELPLVLDWETVQDVDDVSPPVTYDLQVAYDLLFLNLVVDEMDLADSTYTLTGPLPYATYYWQVRALDSAGNASAWTDLRWFVLAPEGIEWKVKLSASGGGVVDLENYAGVAPDASAGYDAYDQPEPPMPAPPFVNLFFDHSDWAFKPDLYSQDIRLSANAVTWDLLVLTSFTGNVTLTWDVSPVPIEFLVEIQDGAGTPLAYPRIETSYTYAATANIPKVLKLFVGLDTAAPAAPTLPAPADDSYITDTAPTFDWSDVFDPSGVTYHLNVVDSQQNVVINQTALTASTFTPTTALADGTYSWKVRATDGAGNVGDWSSTWSFTVDTTAPAITATATPGVLALFGMVYDDPDSPDYNASFTHGPYETELEASVTDASPIASVTVDLQDLVEQMLPTTTLNLGSANMSLTQVQGGANGALTLNLKDDVFAPLKAIYGDGVDRIFAQDLVLGDITLEVTATDAAGNTTTADIALTVIDEMRPVQKGWNLVSAPIALDTPTLTGDLVPATYQVWRYNNVEQRWEERVGTSWKYAGTTVATATLDPLQAAWINAAADDQVELTFARAGYAVPPEAALSAGWNMVSLASVSESMDADQALASIAWVPGGAGQDVTGYAQVVSVAQWVDFTDAAGYDWHYQQDGWVFTRAQWPPETMSVGGGYWVYMVNGGSLGGFSYGPTIPLADALP